MHLLVLAGWMEKKFTRSNYVHSVRNNRNYGSAIWAMDHLASANEMGTNLQKGKNPEQIAYMASAAYNLMWTKQTV